MAAVPEMVPEVSALLLLIALESRELPTDSNLEAPNPAIPVILVAMALLVSAPPLLVSVLTPIPNSGWRGMLLFGGALLVSIALAVYFGTTISRPVQALIDDAHALAVGVAGHRSRIQSSDEIGSLARALNQMAETVERRNAALADSERRYRFLFDSNPLPMWAWDADTMQVLAINDAAIETYGYDRDTFLSLRILDLLDPAEHARFASIPPSSSRSCSVSPAMRATRCPTVVRSVSPRRG